MSNELDAAIQTALKCHQAGDLKQAEAIYRKVLQSDPANADALHLLGVIAYQAGNNDLAVDLIRRAIAAKPGVPDFYNNLGNALRLLGKLDEAVLAFRRALNLAPGFVEAQNNLGLAFRDQGRHEDAIRCFRKGLKSQPDLPDLHNSLGMALLDKSRHDEASRCFNRALELKPGYAQAHNNLGLVLKAQGKIEGALHHYTEALRLDPGLAEAHNNLGSLHRDEDRKDQALACYREALRINPKMIEANLNMASLLHDNGLLREARDRYSALLALHPEDTAALWGHCVAQLEVLYDRVEDIAASREQYRTQLQAFIERTSFDDPVRVRAAARALCEAQPFYIAYQGEVDRELQATYGGFLCRLQSACSPRWSKRLSMPPVGPGGQLRIGIVSGFFCYHSNWKIPIKGWVENLGRGRFALFGYHTGRKQDAETEAARKSFVRFVEDVPGVEQMCQEISSDRLHVLIYPEIGMDSWTTQLAALRLAPVQCVSWGHPNTSGFPTLDYYLSSDLMEPPDADAHYTEKLIRLPNLSIHYTPPDVQPANADRSAFGLRTRTTIYLCAQSLAKYLPQYDDTIARIALEVGACQFVFLHYPKSRHIGDRFAARLRKAFAVHGLEAEKYVVMLPPQDPPHYQSLNGIADVFLDSIGWSGCNSTLEAVRFGLPVVTLPGKLMRGRHSMAVLTMMGMHGTIANSIDEYIRIAVRLGRDAEWRSHISRLTIEKGDCACRDMEPVRGLERFLQEAVDSYPGASGRKHT